MASSSNYEQLWKDALDTQDTDSALQCLRNCRGDVNSFINSRNRKGQTFLHVACKKGSADLVGELLSSNADYHIVDDEDNRPVDLACKAGFRDAELQLLEHEVKQNGIDPSQLKQCLTDPTKLIASCETIVKYELPLNKRCIAIKIVEFPKQKAEAVERLKGQRYLVKLRHHNIVRVFDYKVDDDGSKATVVMELIDGVDLKRRMQAFKMDSTSEVGLDEATIKSYMLQLLHSIVYIKGEKIFHRDIKPANIIIRRDGTLVVVDFGSSAHVETLRADVHSRIGTPCYAAPEVHMYSEGLCAESIGDRPKYDHKVDVFSAGAVFYEMVTQNIPNGDIDDMRNIFKSCCGNDGDKLAVFDAMVCKDPNERMEPEKILQLRYFSGCIELVPTMEAEPTAAISVHDSSDATPQHRRSSRRTSSVSNPADNLSFQVNSNSKKKIEIEEPQDVIFCSNTSGFFVVNRNGRQIVVSGSQEDGEPLPSSILIVLDNINSNRLQVYDIKGNKVADIDLLMDGTDRVRRLRIRDPHRHILMACKTNSGKYLQLVDLSGHELGRSKVDDYSFTGGICLWKKNEVAVSYRSKHSRSILSLETLNCIETIEGTDEAENETVQSLTFFAGELFATKRDGSQERHKQNFGITDILCNPHSHQFAMEGRCLFKHVFCNYDDDKKICLFIAHTNCNSIVQCCKNLKNFDYFTDGLNHPHGIICYKDKDGNNFLAICDTGNNCLKIYKLTTMK